MHAGSLRLGAQARMLVVLLILVIHGNVHAPVVTQAAAVDVQGQTFQQQAHANPQSSPGEGANPTNCSTLAHQLQQPQTNTSLVLNFFDTLLLGGRNASRGNDMSPWPLTSAPPAQGADASASMGPASAEPTAASRPATQQTAATTPAEAVKLPGEAVQADNEGPDDLDVTDRHNWAAAKSGAKILAAHKEVRGQRRRTEESLLVSLFLLPKGF